MEHDFIFIFRSFSYKIEFSNDAIRGLRAQVEGLKDQLLAAAAKLELEKASLYDAGLRIANLRQENEELEEMYEREMDTVIIVLLKYIYVVLCVCVAEYYNALHYRCMYIHKIRLKIFYIMMT